MKFQLFDFNSDDKTDYLSQIENQNIRALVSNFFEPSVISIIPPKSLNLLVKAINEDVKKGIFLEKHHIKLSKTVTNSFNTMSVIQLNSDTHKLFLKIIEENFGKSAKKLLSERKNLNIFNLSEVNVLHQEVFDNFGEVFVNRILNNDLTPQSLIIIKNVLSDKKAMNTFKYYYDFYINNIGDSQVNFERMIRGYDTYKYLFENIMNENKKLSINQIRALVCVLSDMDNKYGVCNIDDVNRFYEIKHSCFEVSKEKARKMFEEHSKYYGIEDMVKAIFENFYGVEFSELPNNFNIMGRNPNSICKYYDCEDLIKNASKSFSPLELEMLEDMYKIVNLSKEESSRYVFEEIEKIGEKYEKIGSRTNLVALKMFEKIPRTFDIEMADSLSTIDLIKKRIERKEQGVYIDKDARTVHGEKVETPVYVFDGADFSFLSTTNYFEGYSGNEIVGDLATSWFEYENGASHISCSYSNQDKLANLEFNKILGEEGTHVTYLFDDAEIFTMGKTDIYSVETPRRSDVFSDSSTKFVNPEKLAKATQGEEYNEVDINRYNYSGEMRYGGKIIPSAILCSERITSLHVEAAKSFTKYCVENGLKPEGWQMPIVVVNKKRYKEIINMKRKGLISKNSEYFMLQEQKKQEETKQDEVKQQPKQEETIKVANAIKI